MGLLNLWDIVSGKNAEIRALKTEVEFLQGVVEAGAHWIKSKDRQIIQLAQENKALKATTRSSLGEFYRFID